MTDSDLERRKFIKAASAAGLVGVAGCTGGPQDDGTATETGEGGTEGADAGATAEASASINVGMVYALGGLGDNSFNDSAKRGIEQAAGEFDVSFDESQPSSASDFQQFQQRYARSENPNYDLVNCIGFAQRDALASTAPDYPEQNFTLIDSVVDEPNVASYTFKEEEGSFLVGALAGLMTSRSFSAGDGSTQSDSTNVGFVGGVDAPLIRKFQAGYEAGVKHVNENVDVITSFVGSFSDPSGGKEAALSMYQSGADIVYHAAGATGAGVFQAAQSEGRFAIGVDSDQSITQPEFANVILASMVKRVDSAVFKTTKNVVKGNHQGGSAVSLGLEQDGVAIVYGDTLGDDIPAEVKTEIDASAKAIIEGEIDVPTKPQ
ncbi:MAG: BMP family protein [Halopenitus sp.]